MTEYASYPTSHTFGNTIADVLAARGAEEHQVKKEEHALLSWVDSRATKLLQRFIAIAGTTFIATEAFASELKEQRKLRKSLHKKTRANLLQKLKEITEHFPMCIGKGWQCARCLSTCGSRGLIRLLRMPCRPLPALARHEDRPLFIDQPLVIAGRPIHATHRLGYKQGVYWCWSCGNYCTRKPTLLVKRCKQSRNSGGQRTINRINKGLTPRTNVSWSDDPLIPAGHVFFDTEQAAVQAAEPAI